MGLGVEVRGGVYMGVVVNVCAISQRVVVMGGWPADFQEVC